MPRPGYSDHRPANVVQAQARQLFLSIADELAPEMLAELREDVLPVYAVTCSEIRRYGEPGVIEAKRAEYQELHDAPVLPSGLCTDCEDPSDWETVRCAGVKRHGVLYPELLPLQKALQSWAKHYGLEREGWVLEAALRRIAQWHALPQVLDTSSLLLPGVTFWEPPVAERFLDFRASWHPATATRADWKADVLKDFDTRLDAYLDAVEEAMEGPEQRERRELELHLRWLVRHSVKHERLQAIAASADRPSKGQLVTVCDDTVQNAVAAAVKLLGMSSRRGRPAGSRTQSTTGNRVTPESRSR